MSDPARYWRADGGYQDAPFEYAPSPAPEVPEGMCPFRRHQAAWPMQPPMYFVQGPIGINGVYTPPPPYVGPPPPTQIPVPPPPPAAKKEEEKKKSKEKKLEKKAENPYAPPGLAKGMNYMFDGEHTMIHIFNKAAPVWTEKYRTQSLQFKIFMVSVNFTVNMVIERTLNKCGEDCKGWAVTEVIELGDGRWDKSNTIEYDGDKAKVSLKSIGWSAKRGDSQPPVWIVVHKVGFK